MRFRTLERNSSVCFWSPSCVNEGPLSVERAALTIDVKSPTVWMTVSDASSIPMRNFLRELLRGRGGGGGGYFSTFVASSIFLRESRLRSNWRFVAALRLLRELSSPRFLMNAATISKTALSISTSVISVTDDPDAKLGFTTRDSGSGFDATGVGLMTTGAAG
jgi:hypothetical protein